MKKVIKLLVLFFLISLFTFLFNNTYRYIRIMLGYDKNSGKSVGQDEKNNRPNAIREFGLEGAKRHLQDILAGAISSIPSCPGEGELAQLVKMQAAKMMEINESKIIV